MGVSLRFAVLNIYKIYNVTHVLKAIFTNSLDSVQNLSGFVAR